MDIIRESLTRSEGALDHLDIAFSCHFNILALCRHFHSVKGPRPKRSYTAANYWNFVGFLIVWNDILHERQLKNLKCYGRVFG